MQARDAAFVSASSCVQSSYDRAYQLSGAVKAVFQVHDYLAVILLTHMLQFSSR